MLLKANTLTVIQNEVNPFFSVYAFHFRFDVWAQYLLFSEWFGFSFLVDFGESAQKQRDARYSHFWNEMKLAAHFFSVFCFVVIARVMSSVEHARTFIKKMIQQPL